MTDDLSAPIQGKSRNALFGIPTPFVVLSFLIVFSATLAGWIFLVDDPLGGEPRKVVELADTETALSSSDIGVIGLRTNLDEEPGGRSNKDQTEKTTTDDDPGPPPVDVVTVRDPTDPTIDAIAITPREQLLEKTAAGFLPKVASDGTSPAQAYARPVDAATLNANLPRVAIVVGGIGLSAGTSDQALEALPVDVTLAFAPYGQRLDNLVRKARQKGHELVLQVPMEPYDFPNNDPGPHTLLTSLKPTENLDRLHWVLAQMTTYAGVVNYMGARYSSDDSAFGATLKELQKRGLYYVDDGSSPRSQALNLTQEIDMPSLRADLIVDGLPDGPSIEGRLLQLEAIARERGLAVGVASAYPISIDVINRWAREAEDRGIVLVPISAAIQSRADAG
ncbi:divergent polysaccharide deacetylase family protein [Coralliovum pocilloporae]|uniref:divergent polysaccharide deacetylase family protein n=1 Tax=Coralliovum pocilloporae TaxID=3066369 RepID=UPI003306EF80